MTLILSLFPGVDLLGFAFELEWPDACIVRGPDVIFGSLSDVRTFHPPHGVFHGIIGGCPCQMFSSLARLVIANGHQPRFGNLIPEFERCVAEAQPVWFIMENVPQAPEPVVAGYGVKAFMIDNSWLNSGDGWGEEQRRVRKFCFGMRGVVEPPSLMRWIDRAVFLLPDAKLAITSGTGFPHDEAFKTRKNTVRATSSMNPGCTGATKATKQRKRVGVNPAALTARRREKHTRHETLVGGGGAGPAARQRQRERTVTASEASFPDNANGGRGAGKKGRYKLADAIRLQGLPEGFLDAAPFTVEGKLRAVANGVALPTGRAIARAIQEALKS